MNLPRIGILGFFHESNTFAAEGVTGDEVRGARLRGEQLVAAHAGSGTVIAGYLGACAELELDAVPLVYSELVPSGRIGAEALAVVREDLRIAVEDDGPWDGLLVCLHGAAVSEDVDDVDGHLLELLRDAVGADVPIAVTLDLHANVTERMISAADILVGYRTNPHVDAGERAVEAATLLARCRDEGRRPRKAHVRLPIALNILAQGTGEDPMAALMAHRARIAARPGVSSVSLFEGYPYADVPDIAMTVLVLADDSGIAADAADELGEAVWRMRSDFDPHAPTADEAVRALGPGTTLLLDVGDNIGGGSPGDSVELLDAARRAGVRSLVTIVHDADAASACIASGEGTRLAITFGTPRLTVDATVERVSDGRYRDSGPTHLGHSDFDAGPTAAVRIDSGQTVILCSRAIMPSSAQQLLSVGVDPRAYRAVVAKGVHSPLAGYRPYVDEVVWVETGGVTPARLETLEYRRRPRPLFPFEPIPAPEPTHRKRAAR